MIRSVILWVLHNVFRVNTETTNNELNDNEKYVNEYEQIDRINFDAIFSNKIANYVASDSNISIDGENKRVELLSKTAQSMWKKIKKISSMSLGYGGVVIVPYVKEGKIFYTIAPQNRLTIDEKTGDLITKATILAERKKINYTTSEQIYYRWTNYQITNNNLVITQKFTNKAGKEIDTPTFWADIQTVTSITNVDRVPFGYIKSPINNRNISDKYGVPITYGCDATINEIRTCLKQIADEFELKETFVGVDFTMFKKDKEGNDVLPNKKLFKKFNASGDDLWEVFSPDIRESSYYTRLEELYTRLEKEVGCSAGILSKVETTSNATATEIRRRMYETWTIVDDMRNNIESGLEDFFYSCNILANAYNLSPEGDYEISYDWDYSLLEDTQQTFSQLIQGVNQDVISKEELRNWLKPDETIEESKKAVKEIEDSLPNVDEMLEGGEEDDNERK